MALSLDLNDFLNLPGLAFDVRSPGEFRHASIAGALSLPLFSDDERAQVGITYKQVGRDEAVELGLRLAGPRFGDMVAEVRALCKGQTAKVFCWRGGMRSGAVAWLLETAGVPVVLLKGGYKQYRRQALQVLDSIGTKGPSIIVLGGMTGAAKTEILQALSHLGEQTLDLEAIASHRGSSYGGIKQPQQPSTEHFENEIARLWKTFTSERRVWIEDESRQIGRLRIPEKLHEAILKAPVIVVDKPIDERIDHLASIYGTADQAELIAATQRLTKRLGSQRTEQIVNAITNGDMKSFIRLALEYYDPAYEHGLTRRNRKLLLVKKEGLSHSVWAKTIMDHIKAHGL